MNKANPPFMGCETDFKKAEIVLFGAPFDGTVSYRPGARFAGTEIRRESYGLETYSPYLERDLEECHVFDGGELDLPFGNPRKALDMIGAAVKEILAAEKKPLMIGGEHLVTLGAVEVLAQHQQDLHMLHFDAHADLREEYMGETLSHATVLRRCHNLLGDGTIYQLGIRSMTKDEAVFSQDHVRQHRYDLEALPSFLEELRDVPVYVTIDLDVMDPCCFPGTGTPEPGGVAFLDLMRGVHQLRELNIIGADVVELAPHYDTSGVSTVVAAKIIRELLLVM